MMCLEHIISLSLSLSHGFSLESCSFSFFKFQTPRQLHAAAALWTSVGFFTLPTNRADLGYPCPNRLHVWAYVSLGSHEEYAQEQLTISGGGAPTFSERG